MYSVTYRSDNGKEILLGKDGGMVCDVNLGNGISVDMSLMQGFSQIGQSVEGKSVGGKTINIKGVIYNSVYAKKQALRDIFAPLSAGYLFFEDKYKIRVHVKATPTFSTKRDDGRFTMQLFAPDPFFYSIDEKSELIGKTEPKFSFPVNYAEPHLFGETSKERSLVLNNNGNVPAPYSLELVSMTDSLNPVLSNLNTFEVLKINGNLELGDRVHIHRNENGLLRAELTRGDETIDILSWIDESSNFYALNVGENLVAINDEGGGLGLMARISFNPAVTAVYES